jgi:hypothetical protein
MIPIIEVSHLPSSSSFYAAITQPLGIQYLCAGTSSPTQLHFGIPAQPSEILFSLQQSPQPRPSTLTISALSSSAVTAFHTLALEANTFQSTNLIQHTPDAAVAKTTDLDGNVLEARYTRSRRASAGGNGNTSGTVITTASTAKEARRVLDWQREVARSVSDSSSTRDLSPERSPPGLAQTDFAPPKLSRAGTFPLATGLYNELTSNLAEKTKEAQESGISAQTLIGTLLGAAAGAAVAYAMVKGPEKKEKDERERPKPVTYYSGPAAPVMEVARSRVGGSQAGSQRGSQVGQRYVLRYNVDPNREEERRSMHYISHDVGAGTGPSMVSLPRSKTETHVSKTSRMSERPLTILEGDRERDRERRSETGSRHTESSRHHDNYVSSKSQVSSASTVKPPKSSSSRSKVGSAAGTERGLDWERERESYHAPTIVSLKSESRKTTVSERARRMPLPESVVGGYAGSVAPSDSISNVGSNTSRARREREFRRETY